MTGQVQVVSILMIIQGVLECLTGILLWVASFLVPGMFHWMNLILEEQQKQQPPGEPKMPGLPEEFVWILQAAYLAIGATAFLAGTLKIIAGIRGLQFRGRVFGIVALAAGCLAWPTCYCAPTGLGLMIYGLIVYCHADVGRAFAMAKEGKSPQEIREFFSGKSTEVGPDVPREEW